MRKIITILVIFAPVLAFGQVTSSVESGKEQKKSSSGKSGILRDFSKIEPHRHLILLNNIPQDSIPDLASLDIETISILKGIDAAVLYGTRGMDRGVTVITTKDYEERKQNKKDKEDAEEYEAIVFDPGFELFLTTQHSKEFYSESALKSKNTLMVSEWNSRHLQPTVHNPDIYEVSIDYCPDTDYGIDVEYTLYMFFKFMEKEHNIKLI